MVIHVIHPQEGRRWKTFWFDNNEPPRLQIFLDINLMFLLTMETFQGVIRLSMLSPMDHTY